MDWTKFLSRKFLLTLGGCLLTLVIDGLGIDVPRDTLMTVWTFIVSYIVGQSAVDVATVLKK